MAKEPLYPHVPKSKREKYTINELTAIQLAERQERFPESDVKPFEVMDGTIRLAYCATRLDAEQEINEWKAREKVEALAEEVFGSIWAEVKDSGLDDEEVREIIKSHI